MGAQQTFVIVGAGLAGAKAAEALRSEGFNGRILLFGAEPERPYERPPLSKSFLQGTSERAKIYVHPKQWYADHDIELHTSTKVTAIDRAQREIQLGNGNRLAYDKLLLTTGASPRELPDAGPHSVYYLRRVEDSIQLRFAFTQAKRVVIIGGGWIGLEVAAAARAANVEVVLLERGDVPLMRILGRETAAVFARLHRAHGVDLRTSTHLRRIISNADGRATGVQLNDGTRVDADLVVVGVGALPNTSLAEDAGLHVDNGITVDEHLRTSDPDIFAAGDVANAFHPMLGRHLRMEHWFNAFSQPAVAARSMLGLAASYDEVPYFYSDQYELGMEYSGFVESGGYDQVIVRGNMDTLEFVAFWLKDLQVLAGMNVNVWDVTEVIKDLVRSGLKVDGVKLADASIPLAEVLADAKNAEPKNAGAENTVPTPLGSGQDQPR
ncbi:ferredoxin reductase [Arthrobacter sp. PAMC 25486]|uniref:NAD(P)/FAD-dependent oxidoreductase n=1 Tax=Arthrobacter sp. PAMC 25486 TaxID=1494608 RepID=UPI000535BC90|nr:FAD-dependent oxidoreductase [Arthrobacter sp. PAMC 25486]AIX99945.1 ferredoxin reductase [Arthrobacter sp. PAMC 25486]